MNTEIGGSIVPSSARLDAPSTRRTSKASHVYITIKESILSGDLSPGSAIDKLALCERLGMSRFPVSTAVNRLAFEKLVVIEPQHGSFVSRISLTDVREFMLIRRAIEADIAAEAAKAASPALNDELDRSLRYQAAAAEAADHAGFYQLDVGFHQMIVQSLGLTHAGEVLDRLLSHLERVRRLLITPPGRSHQTLAEHREIARAIAAGDPAASSAAARSHLERTSAMFETFARDNPKLFAETSPAHA